MFIIKKRYKEGKKKVTKRMNMSSINQYKIDVSLKNVTKGRHPKKKLQIW